MRCFRLRLKDRSNIGDRHRKVEILTILQHPHRDSHDLALGVQNWAARRSMGNGTGNLKQTSIVDLPNSGNDSFANCLLQTFRITDRENLVAWVRSRRGKR